MKYVIFELIMIIVPLNTFIYSQLSQSHFHYRPVTFSSQFKSKVGHTLANSEVFRINLNLDGAPIASRSHTRPSHFQPSHLLTLSLFLGFPVPHTT